MECDALSLVFKPTVLPWTKPKQIKSEAIRQTEQIMKYAECQSNVNQSDEISISLISAEFQVIFFSYQGSCVQDKKWQKQS